MNVPAFVEAKRTRVALLVCHITNTKQTDYGSVRALLATLLAELHVEFIDPRSTLEAVHSHYLECYTLEHHASLGF